MKRVRATALVLVNWSGVFYERYLLDRNVTALEGANGAGKTTVLIAAYIVLLPDMSYVRFTNVGEHSGTAGDKGLYGRLGESGRPSYAVMEFRLPDGERLLAGVHLERRGEPSVELTPFLVRNIEPSISLQDLLLQRSDVDSVPELPQLRDQIARVGGRLHTYSTVKEYFNVLFDAGVMPLRLTTDEERSKFNDMLRTSMTGGISRALTTDLREFLLKQEMGLADTLKQMRANLDACRRTRREVEESRRLQEEIDAVYSAGNEMFAAALHATRERSEELERRVHSAREAVRQAEHQYEDLSGRFSLSSVELERLRSHLEDLRASLEKEKGYLRSIQQAQVVRRRMEDRQGRLSTADDSLKEAQVVQSDAIRQRDSARVRNAEAQKDRDRAAEGLADFQKGLEELTRRAEECRATTESWNEVRSVWPGEAIFLTTITQAIMTAETSRRAAERAFIEIECTISTAEAKRTEHQEILSALGAIEGVVTTPIAAFERARAVLAHLARLETLAAEREQLPAKLEEAKKLAARQSRASGKALSLASNGQDLASQLAVERAVVENETVLRRLEQRDREEETAAREAEQVARIERDKIRELEMAVGKWWQILATAQSLEQQYTCILRSRADVVSLRSELMGHRDAARDLLAETETKRDRLHEEALRLEQTGGVFSDELLAVRDLVDGDLVAARFEEVEADEAPIIQALLGPLADGILVDDPRVACEEILKATKRPESVWLLGGDATLNVDELGRPPGEVWDGNVLVTNPEAGWRVSKVSQQATIGRRARERRIAELRAEEAGELSEVERNKALLLAIETSVVSTEQVLSESAVLERGDPSGELEFANRNAVEGAERARQHWDEGKRIRAAMEDLRVRQQTLRELLPDAWLLDVIDYERRFTELDLQLKHAVAAAAKLQTAGPHRRILEDKLDVLRRPPPVPSDIAELEREGNLLGDELSMWIRLLPRLRYVEEHRTALEWTDAESTLRRERQLAPALQEQLDSAKLAVEALEEQLESAEKTLQAAVHAFNNTNALVESLTESLNRDREELTQIGVEDSSDAARKALETKIREAEAEAMQLGKGESRLSREVNRDSSLLAGQAEEEVRKARGELEDEEKAWRPENDRWQRLRSAASNSNLLGAALASRFVESFSGQGSPNLRQKARDCAAALKERLTRARESQLVQAVVEGLLGSQELSGEICLQAWLAVRDWLRQRLPAQIAEVDDPSEALGRLKDHLAVLEARLTRQEIDLRGESEDVARSIDIHIRRAQRQVLHLNRDLEHVRFGSIQGVRLRLERVERMENVLRALREGQAQQLLFDPGMPIEDALEEIFRQYGGRSGGQRLLDYREYVDPRVEVKRQASDQWEMANPNRLSTGEAIGIGAALMMVVLTSWERDANLLRLKRSDGTLRLLFLDEANRLDRQNLGVLFDLCQSLDLQLLLAAPEVASAEGNTTYHLVRRLGTDGREEVIVTGRRTILEGSV